MGLSVGRCLQDQGYSNVTLFIPAESIQFRIIQPVTVYTNTMDKNTLIAIGLSAAILIVWNVLFPPPPPQQAPEPVAEEEQVVVSRSQESHEESVETAETLPSSLNGVPKVSESLLSREVVVETSK
jgi:hypothetical protein